MEQQNKFYTPDIKELHVGWEGQLMNRLNGKWEETKLTGYDIQELYMTDSSVLDICIKGKYLDKEDIESCGWEIVWEDNKEQGYKMVKPSAIKGQAPDEWELTHYDKIVYISSEYSNRCFDGFCPSINELRAIMKLLQIS